MKNVLFPIVNIDQIQSTPFPAFILNKSGQIVYWNSLSEQFFHFSQSDFLQLEDEHEKTLFSAIPVQTQQQIATSTRPLQLANMQLVTKSNTLTDVSLLTRPCKFKGSQAVYVLCVPTNDTQTLDRDNQLQLSLYEGLNTSFMMVTFDYDGFITNCNPAFLKTSEWTPKRVLGKTFWQLFPNNEESIAVAQNIWQTITNGDIWQGEVEKITKNGHSYWVHSTAIPVPSTDNTHTQYVMIEKDITKEKTLQLRLEKIAYIDTETGLMNIHRLEQIVTKMTKENRHFSFVYLSIDKFYTLKELHQNVVGDSLSVEFTKRLKMYFQDSTMARINETDFVILTPLPDWFTQGFISYLQQNPIYDGNAAVQITLSGGITRYPEDQSSFSQIMKASIATIQAVREAGGAMIQALSKSTHMALNRKSLVEKRLLQALDNKNLHVLYQPQLDVTTGRLTAVEALVRWNDEVIGVVSPDELIPIAEETGLINNIGSFMLEKACEQALKWYEAGIDLKVTVNSSVREFRDKNMAKSILETLERTGCPPQLLQIEITEKFALEAEAEASIIKQMRQLESEGIKFALDDFGTGYASFRYMQLLPIEILKIDQTFTHSLLQSEKSQRLIHGMVQFGKSMNLTVIAEGVETDEQRELLTSFGCDALQGYLISKPVTPKEISELYTAAIK